MINVLLLLQNVCFPPQGRECVCSCRHTRAHTHRVQHIATSLKCQASAPNRKIQFFNFMPGCSDTDKTVTFSCYLPPERAWRPLGLPQKQNDNLQKLYSRPQSLLHFLIHLQTKCFFLLLTLCELFVARNMQFPVDISTVPGEQALHCYSPHWLML